MARWRQEFGVKASICWWGDIEEQQPLEETAGPDLAEVEIISEHQEKEVLSSSDDSSEERLPFDDLDGRILPDEPIIKTSNPYTDWPSYLCPHCASSITPANTEFQQYDPDAGTPDEVMEHIRGCDGIKGYTLGRVARRRRKRQWFREHLAEAQQ